MYSYSRKISHCDYLSLINFNVILSIPLVVLLPMCNDVYLDKLMLGQSLLYFNLITCKTDVILFLIKVHKV